MGLFFPPIEGNVLLEGDTTILDSGEVRCLLLLFKFDLVSTDLQCVKLASINLVAVLLLLEAFLGLCRGGSVLLARIKMLLLLHSSEKVPAF